MNELYWIITIGHLSTLFTFFCIVIFGILFGLWIIKLLVDQNEQPNDKELYKSDKKWAKIFATIGIISALGIVFIPSQKELLAIYGIGGIIDYIKSNDTAKQLPDKCINALDKYLNEITDDKD